MLSIDGPSASYWEWLVLLVPGAASLLQCAMVGLWDYIWQLQIQIVLLWDVTNGPGGHSVLLPWSQGLKLQGFCTYDMVKIHCDQSCA